MSNLQIPSITIEDLQAFQTKHFPGQIHHTPTFHDTFDEYAFAEEEYDLGYYPDGAKRTLTDEQIRIFRHSEIHSILRERELREENEAMDSSTKERGIDDDNQVGKRNNTASDNDGKSAISTSTASKDSGSQKERLNTQANVNTESGSLDYCEDESYQNNGQTKTPPTSGVAIFGRRIISYADD